MKSGGVHRHGLPVLIPACLFLFATAGFSLVSQSSGLDTVETRPADTSNLLVSQVSWKGLNVVGVADWWEFDPASLPVDYIPILLTITNKSDHPIDIDLSDFNLVDKRGKAHKVVLPEKIIERLGNASPVLHPRTRFATDAAPVGNDLISFAARTGSLVAKSKTKHLKMPGIRPAPRSMPVIRTIPRMRIPSRTRTAPSMRTVPVYRARPNVTHDRDQGVYQRPMTRPGSVRNLYPRGTRLVPGRTPSLPGKSERMSRGTTGILQRPPMDADSQRRLHYRELQPMPRGPVHGGDHGPMHGWPHGRHRHRHHHRHWHHACVYIGVPLAWWGCHPYWGCFGPYPWPYQVYADYYVQTARSEAGNEKSDHDVTALALGEGILDPGHKISGFLFFERSNIKPPFKLQWEIWGEQGDLPLSTMDLIFETKSREN
ncbi:MAG: hypothetical protein GXP49_03990 [Deltaproteobacteria bacterium]|nr:hypothetical protein [Deltaproteobacteria bacterium]